MFTDDEDDTLLLMEKTTREAFMAGTAPPGIHFFLEFKELQQELRRRRLMNDDGDYIIHT